MRLTFCFIKNELLPFVFVLSRFLLLLVAAVNQQALAARRSSVSSRKPSNGIESFGNFDAFYGD